MAIIKSDQFELIKQDLQKVLVGALIAGGGVALTYILEIVGQKDFGDFSPVVAGFCAVLINIIRKFVTANTYK